LVLKKEKGKPVERQGRKATGLKLDTMAAGLLKEVYLDTH